MLDLLKSLVVQHAKLKDRSLTRLIVVLPPLDAMEHLFRGTATAWIILRPHSLQACCTLLTSGTAASSQNRTFIVAWLGMALALWQHLKEVGNKYDAKTCLQPFTVRWLSQGAKLIWVIHDGLRFLVRERSFH